MALHKEAAGKEAIQKGLRSLYSKLAIGELDSAVQEKLVRLVTAVETRSIALANQAREQIVRTTTTGWVEGGTWQWVLRHLIAAAQDEAPMEAAGGCYNAPVNQEISEETAYVIKSLGELLDVAQKSLDGKKCDDIAKKLESLCDALRNGFVNNVTCQQLVAIAQFAEQKDSAAAHKCLQEIARTDFQNTKTWLPALKQLFR